MTPTQVIARIAGQTSREFAAALQPPDQASDLRMLVAVNQLAEAYRLARAAMWQDDFDDLKRISESIIKAASNAGLDVDALCRRMQEVIKEQGVPNAKRD
jgi:hypothetical protein